MIDELIRRGVEFLVAGQHPDGWWSDYWIDSWNATDGLPIGASDQWVTAYVANALLDAAAKGSQPRARAAAERAAAWLGTAGRSYAQGWGYNARTGPDADSTAWTSILLQRLERNDGLAEAFDFLLSCRRDDGGFATYRAGAGWWSAAHPDVGVVAFRALPVRLAEPFRAAFWTHANRGRDQDGLWPSYWWSSPWYHAFNLLLLAAADGAEMEPPPPLDPDHPRLRDAGATEFALAAAAEALGHGRTPLVAEALRRLRVRAPTGGPAWPVSPCLRIPLPSEADPDRAGARVGAPLTDPNGLMTAAHIVRSLCVVADPRTAVARSADYRRRP